MTRTQSSLAANDQFVVPRLLTAVAALMVGFGALSLLFGRGELASKGRGAPRRATLEAPGPSEPPALEPALAARPSTGITTPAAGRGGAAATSAAPR